jgi:DNA transposition AAA+ family ATPase
VKQAEIEIIVPPQPQVDEAAQRQIERLQRHCIVELEAVRQFHSWLDDKRHCRQACRLIGDSRTGKTFACDAYRLKHPPTQTSGDAPSVPVIYWQPPPKPGSETYSSGCWSD